MDRIQIRERATHSKRLQITRPVKCLGGLKVSAANFTWPWNWGYNFHYCWWLENTVSAPQMFRWHNDHLDVQMQISRIMQHTNQIASSHKTNRKDSQQKPHLFLILIKPNWRQTVVGMLFLFTCFFFFSTSRWLFCSCLSHQCLASVCCVVGSVKAEMR